MARRKWTPICPRCGSVRCAVIEDSNEIECRDCEEVAPAIRFRQTTSPVLISPPRNYWHDGAALSMDGVEEN